MKHLADLGIDGKTILKWILDKRDMMMKRFSWQNIGKCMGSGEHGFYRTWNISD
jgi:hypothetical protein